MPFAVLHVIPRFIGGGPERSLLAFAAAEGPTGPVNQHSVAVLEAPASARLFLAARRLGIKLFVRPTRDLLDSLIASSDVLLIHFWNHPALMELLRSGLPPARVLVWSHMLGTRAPQVLTEAVGRFADSLVVTSQLSRESEGARAASAHGTPVNYVPGIADMSRLDGFEPRSHDGIRVGYIGVVNDAKMHPRFAEMSAAVRTPDIRFAVWGSGGGEAALARRFAALGMSDRVTIGGHTEDIRSALETVDIFGYPLVEDTYATSEKAVQEAMWVGIPPVVLGHGGLPGLVEHERTGLVAASEAEYPLAIERLAADATLRRYLGDNARRFARAEFDAERLSHALSRILTGLLAEPRRARSPLPGADRSAAENFVLSLGHQAGPFSLCVGEEAPSSGGPVLAGEHGIAAASPLLAFGEGGVAHYSNAYPGDPHLRRWTSLIGQARASTAASLAAASD